ncbi:response regulator [Microseira wollei]|uniref:Two-component response regulator n=1 Tax=Microseira wollei NIES-4236 TaxID=2530354 RepID=A0AAV3XSG7_9CYAN|nr:response regulator [Microseira wollei]GET43405.1 two-component response regulator [Microseira wollei NIES-4236]
MARGGGRGILHPAVTVEATVLSPISYISRLYLKKARAEAVSFMSHKQILLIDHEASVREVLQICLSSVGGWQVISVASIQSGLKKLCIERVDAILLDTPNLETDGITFIQTIKNDPSTPSVPVIFITAKAKSFLSHQLPALGIAGAIAKPFNAMTLPIQVAGMLNWSLGSEFVD